MGSDWVKGKEILDKGVEVYLEIRCDVIHTNKTTMKRNMMRTNNRLDFKILN